MKGSRRLIKKETKKPSKNKKTNKQTKTKLKRSRRTSRTRNTGCVIVEYKAEIYMKLP